MKSETSIEKKDTTSPLVSIIVITYNSSRYVLETLESAKAQTYQNIELIVSDDCSRDNTVEICRDWIKENKERFVRTEVISVDKNTGISPNCNRGLHAAKGEWVKLIAGDDILIEDSIFNFVKFISEKKECSIVFGRIYFLKNDKLEAQKINPFFNLPISEQKVKIYTGSGLPTPALFLKKSLLLEVGGFNEKYKMIEDVPLWIAIACKNQYFYSFNSFVVKYRLHDNNISMSNKWHVNPVFYADKKKLIMSEILPELWILKKYLVYFNYWNYIKITDIIVRSGNKNNYISNLLSFMILENNINNIKRVFSLFKTKQKKPETIRTL